MRFVSTLLFLTLFVSWFPYVAQEATPIVVMASHDTATTNLSTLVYIAPLEVRQSLYVWDAQCLQISQATTFGDWLSQNACSAASIAITPPLEARAQLVVLDRLSLPSISVAPPKTAFSSVGYESHTPFGHIPAVDQAPIGVLAQRSQTQSEYATPLPADIQGAHVIFSEKRYNLRC